MTTLFHTSRVEITKITTRGRFDEFLFFASEPYFFGNSASTRSFVYSIDVESTIEDGIIDASRIFWHDDAEKLESLVNEFSERFDIDTDTAEKVISERECLACVTGDYTNDGEAQLFTARAAKILGFRGVRVTDEQGSAWMLDMTNPANAMTRVAQSI